MTDSVHPLTPKTDMTYDWQLNLRHSPSDAYDTIHPVINKTDISNQRTPEKELSDSVPPCPLPCDKNHWQCPPLNSSYRHGSPPTSTHSLTHKIDCASLLNVWPSRLMVSTNPSWDTYDWQFPPTHSVSQMTVSLVPIVLDHCRAIAMSKWVNSTLIKG